MMSSSGHCTCNPCTGIPIAFIYFEGETWELPQITKTVNEMVGFGYDGGLYPHWIIQYWAIHQYLL